MLGPTVAPGRYTAALQWESQPAREIAILPDPDFPLPDAERSARETALMRSYNLQRQLRPTRETTRLLAERIGVLSELARTAGAGATANPKTFESLALDVSQARNQAYNAINAAARVESDIDAYAGPPTAAQLRELDWAWSDAQAAVAALNRVIEAMPALEKAAGKDAGGREWKPVSLTP